MSWSALLCGHFCVPLSAGCGNAVLLKCTADVRRVVAELALVAALQVSSQGQNDEPGRILTRLASLEDGKER